MSKNIADVTLKSLHNKWKDARFAAGVDRAHVAEATADFSRACFSGQLELWQHIENVLTAMQQNARLPGLDGQSGVGQPV